MNADETNLLINTITERDAEIATLRSKMDVCACIYCGKEHKKSDPNFAQVISDHIMSCPKNGPRLMFEKYLADQEKTLQEILKPFDDTFLGPLKAMKDAEKLIDGPARQQLSDQIEWLEDFLTPPTRTQIVPSDDFFILSIKHSPDRGNAVWWGKDDCGYFSDLKSAGIYTREKIDSDRGYYDNKESTVAVPVYEMCPNAYPLPSGPVNVTVDYNKVLSIINYKPKETSVTESD